MLIINVVPVLPLQNLELSLFFKIITTYITVLRKYFLNTIGLIDKKKSRKLKT